MLFNSIHSLCNERFCNDSFPYLSFFFVCKLCVYMYVKAIQKLMISCGKLKREYGVQTNNSVKVLVFYRYIRYSFFKAMQNLTCLSINFISFDLVDINLVLILCL